MQKQNKISSQQALLSLIENLKKVVEKKRFEGTILMDLCKAFDTIKHYILTAKLYAYGFNKESLKFLHRYLSNRWLRIKINKQFSSWTKVIQGELEGSVFWSSSF